MPAAAAALAAYEDAIADAFEVYRRALDGFERELAQQEGEAFGDHFSGDVIAGTTWREATQRATTVRAQALAQALGAALEADGRARFIRSAFASRLEEADKQCEAEKRDVLTRMRRDLDAAARNT